MDDTAVNEALDTADDAIATGVSTGIFTIGTFFEKIFAEIRAFLEYLAEVFNRDNQ